MSGRSSKRSKRPASPAWPRTVETHSAVGEEELLVLCRAMHPACVRCGSAVLVWGDVAAGMWSAVTASQRESLRVALKEFAHPGWPAAWCAYCDGVAVIQPPELLWA